MQSFSCKRCGFETNRKDNLKRHLKRKKICKPLLSDISVDNLFKQVSIIPCQPVKIITTSNDDNIYICPKCHISYKHKSSYTRHVGTSECFKEMENDKPLPKLRLKESNQNSLSNILDSDFYDEYLTLKFEELKNQHLPSDNEHLSKLKTKINTLENTMVANSVPTLAELMSQKEPQVIELEPINSNINTKPESNHQNNQLNQTTTNISKINGDNNQLFNSQIDNRYQNNQHNNITNNIYINEFGKEDTDHISKKEWKRIINKFYQAIPTLVKKIHIDKQSNQNVFIPSIKDNYALVYEKDDWQFRALTQVLEDIIVANADRLYDFINENEGEIDEHAIMKLDTIMEQLENGDTLYKTYQREIKHLLLNNRNLIKDHYETHYLKPLKHR